MELFFTHFTCFGGKKKENLFADIYSSMFGCCIILFLTLGCIFFIQCGNLCWLLWRIVFDKYPVIQRLYFVFFISSVFYFGCCVVNSIVFVFFSELIVNHIFLIVFPFASKLYSFKKKIK